MTKIDLTLMPENLQRTTQRVREKRFYIPTLAQQKDPALIPAHIKEQLKTVGLWDLDPLNLFRITWHNEARASGGLFGNVNYVEFPPELTGVPARVVALVGKGCEFSVLEEIYKENRLWLRLQAPYARYLCAEENGMIYARRLLTYSSNPAGTGWAESVTVFLKSIGYTGPEPQVEKGSTSWQSL
jgi:hypothetical protein